MSDDTTANVTVDGAVTEAFTALVNALKASAMGGDANTFLRSAEYMRAVAEVETNYNAGLPVSGKPKGRPGRKPKSATAVTENADGSTTEHTGAVDAGDTGEASPRGMGRRARSA